MHDGHCRRARRHSRSFARPLRHVNGAPLPAPCPEAISVIPRRMSASGMGRLALGSDGRYRGSWGLGGRETGGGSIQVRRQVRPDPRPAPAERCAGEGRSGATGRLRHRLSDHDAAAMRVRITYSTVPQLQQLRLRKLSLRLSQKRERGGAAARRGRPARFSDCRGAGVRPWRKWDRRNGSRR